MAETTAKAKHALKMPKRPGPREFDECATLVSDTEPFTADTAKELDKWAGLVFGTKRSKHAVLKQLELFSRSKTNEVERLVGLITGSIVYGIALGAEIQARADKGVIILPTPPTLEGK